MITTDDRQIMELLAERDETALRILSSQYGSGCRRMAAEILGNDADAEEVCNDALLHIWNAIPPAKPENLPAYLRAAVRQLAYQRLEKRNAQKRGGGQQPVSLDALAEHQQPAENRVEQLMDEALLDEAVRRFLHMLSYDARTVFVHHYGNGRTIREIAEAFGLSQSKVAVTLMRTRLKLRKYLNEEGWL